MRLESAERIRTATLFGGGTAVLNAPDTACALQLWTQPDAVGPGLEQSLGICHGVFAAGAGLRLGSVLLSKSSEPETAPSMLAPSVLMASEGLKSAGYIMAQLGNSFSIGAGLVLSGTILQVASATMAGARS